MTNAQEHEWVRRARAGDQAAFGEIVHCHQQAIFNVAYRLLENVPDAEDAAQEAFLRAYQFLGTFDSDRPLRPWLKQIAANVCLNRLEGQKPSSPLDEELAHVPDPNPSPEALKVQLDRDERIRFELKRLPPRYRIVIELRHFQGLSYEQIASELGQPLSDVKSNLFRARRLLAERLKDLR
jgi:RNA polymerase sigma-70 factor (ECF subfamily)